MTNPERQEQHLSRKQLRRLRRSERAAQQNEFDPSRRRFLIAGALIGGGVALGGLGLLARLLMRSNSKLETYLETYREDEQKIDNILQQTDQAIDIFSQKLSAKLEALSLEQRMALLSPLDTYNHNRLNPERNKARFLRIDLEQRVEDALRSSTQYSLPDYRYFFVNLLKGQSMAASFSPVDRTIDINERFSASNMLDALELYHELTHVEQDAQTRTRLPTQEHLRRYQEFYTVSHGSPMRIIGAFEQEAYIKEILVLDLLMDGRLKHDATQGGIDLNLYVRQLGIRSQQRDEMEIILKIANEMFRSGSSTAYIAPSFADYINRLYRNQGYGIYEIKDGKVQIVN